MSLPQQDLFGRAAFDESDGDDGYDSEAAEVYKASRRAESGRSLKRRKLSLSDSDGDESEAETKAESSQKHALGESEAESSQIPAEAATTSWTEEQGEERRAGRQQTAANTGEGNGGTEKKKKKEKRGRGKERRAGVIYLSSIPPHLRPSALRNLLEQRGFGPVTRLFLTPITTDAAKKSASKARRSYAEGWVEFASHKTAKLCAHTLNATAIGGKKGSYYRDDLWNMKYLRGMGWEELMDGVRGEKREDEARRDEERRQIQRDAKTFLEGVEQGKKLQGMREKRKTKGDEDQQRTFRQFEAHKTKATAANAVAAAAAATTVDETASQVLSKIF